MEQLIEYLLTTEYSAYVIGLCFICRAFVTVAPTSLTTKIPDVVMMVVNVLALSSNKAVDNKGNAK